ncbi:MAG: hypothetical protein A2X48_13495 [Lentisphaerae bacterium GWF2_49_21]|nr:MAG: hypothetical protein A2X48_13495 [Lentisphaerae bacterium GWF2_49_21]
MAIQLCTTAADAPAAKPAQPGGKTIKILLIGNSFSQNATEYLPKLVESQGNSLILGHAELGGCSLEKHWGMVEKFEANPADKESKYYNKKSLKEMLEGDKWDIVTMQQHSWLSYDIKTYQPFATKLADFIRKHAPQAKIYLQETWAYRKDDMGLLKKTNITPEQMYVKLNGNYAKIANEIKADKIIPSGTAFQNIGQDPRWLLELQENVDKAAFKYPDLPLQKHSLIRGWGWTKKDGKSSTSLTAKEIEERAAGKDKGGDYELTYDAKHCNSFGKYMLALVWYETIYGELTKPAFKPADIPEADAAIIREYAHKTVKEGLKPQMPGKK